MFGRKRGARFLATVVFTDIAGSTEIAAQLGDEEWSKLLWRHLLEVRVSLRRRRGREVDTAGDGFYATFDAPGPAIAFALDVNERAAPLGIQLRSGIHTGEVEVIAGKVGGLTVHIGARIAALAQPGEVLVSSTVRELAAGSGYLYDARGESELKGVPGRWPLAAVRQAPTTRPSGLAPPVRRRRPLPRWIGARLATALTVFVAIAAGGAFLVLGRTPLFSDDGANNSLAIIDPDTNAVTHVTLPGAPSFIAATSGGVWLAQEAGPVFVVDPASRGISRIPVDTRPTGIAIERGTVWVPTAVGMKGTLVGLDATTHSIVSNTFLDFRPGAIASGNAELWLVDSAADDVRRIDAASGAHVSTSAVGAGPAKIVVAGGTVWVSNDLDSTVSLLTEATGNPDTTIRLGFTPGDIAADSHTLCVIDLRAAAVVLFDAHSLRELARVHVGSDPQAVAIGGDVIWVANGRDKTVTRIDLPSRTVSATISVGGNAVGLAITSGEVWVAVRA